MNNRATIHRLKQKLIDAEDGKLHDEELRQLEEMVRSRYPALWEQHLWSMNQQKKQGIFEELAALHDVQPEEGAIRRFYAHYHTRLSAGSELEALVWSWFRRYVLTVGLVLVVLFSGLQLGNLESNEDSGHDQVEQFLGWDPEDLPELDHWLYADL